MHSTSILKHQPLGLVILDRVATITQYVVMSAGREECFVSLTNESSHIHARASPPGVQERRRGVLLLTRINDGDVDQNIGSFESAALMFCL